MSHWISRLGEVRTHFERLCRIDLMQSAHASSAANTFTPAASDTDSDSIQSALSKLQAAKAQAVAEENFAKALELKNMIAEKQKQLANTQTTAVAALLKEIETLQDKKKKAVSREDYRAAGELTETN